jgi:NADH dehydrogenase
MTTVLLCGGTGHLGGAIARRLAERDVTLRALVRPQSEAGPLRALGADIRSGDLTDRGSLDRAVDGADVVVTTANAIGRILDGAKGLTIDAVDRRGNAHLLHAAEAAGVRRFVFVSAAGINDAMVARAPFAAAKQQAEQLVEASAVPSVIVRPTAFQDFWLTPASGIDPAKRRAVIFGRGKSLVSYIAVDDVAEACVRLALADAPPSVIELGGPEQLTRHQVVDAVERAYGTRFRRISVPRPVLAAAARLLRRIKPAMASVMGMALGMDIDGLAVDAAALRSLGIEPRPMTEAIAAMPGTRMSSP